MDRCYIPEDDLARNRSSVEEIKQFMATPGLRATLNGLLDQVERLNHIGAELPAREEDKRLKVETAMIVSPRPAR